MCGRYTLTSQEGLVEDLEAALDPSVPSNEWWKPRFNVAPTQDAPVVTIRSGHEAGPNGPVTRGRDGARRIEMMRWGLVPFWGTKPGSRPPLMINARVESIDTKRVFRDALERRRCLVPADGFFEWRHAGKQATPVWLHPFPHRFIAFAGLWARAKTDHGELHSFTIITGPANDLVRGIHDRMPVVLPRDAWAAWLDPSLPADGAHALLGVPPVDDWRGDEVSPYVNKPDHDDAQCIAPVAPPAQRSLFE